MTTPSSPAVCVRNLCKRFGDVDAVVDCSFDIHYGLVTGYLGPNGAGKTTTLRMMLELIRPTSGMVLVAGRRYSSHPRPAEVVGSMFELTGFYAGTTARSYVRICADAVGAPMRRADEVLEIVGLSTVAKRSTKKMSLGMRQRLQLAVALLGNPSILILDEPTNGLDPEGITWFRSFVRAQASLGKAVLISSHLLAEVAQTVDRVVIIAEGRLRANCSLSQLTTTTTVASRVEVRSDNSEKLEVHLRALGFQVVKNVSDPASLLVDGATAEQVGTLASSLGLSVFKLAEHRATLEDVYLALTRGAGLTMGTIGGSSSPALATSSPLPPRGF